MLQIAVDSELCDRKDAAEEVEQDLLNRPAVGRAVAEVGEDLGHVFYECDEDLDVGNRIDLQFPLTKPFIKLHH